jgi:flagellin
MRINHNIAALNTYRQLAANNSSAQKAIEKLSSGLRINRAGDDAAGLAISEKMRSQIRGLEMASRNAQDGISLIQTAEGALNETQSILQRMRELAVQAKNGTNTDKDRQALNEEYAALLEEITRIADETEFNSLTLLNGTATIGSGTTSEPTFDFTGLTGITKIEVADGAQPGTPVAGTYKLEYTAAVTEEEPALAKLKITHIENATLSQEVDIEATTGSVELDFSATLGITVTVNAEDLTTDLTDETFTITAGTSSGTSTGLTLTLQIGANNGQEMEIEIGNMTAEALGVNGTSIEIVDNAENALTAVEEALEDVSAQRSKLGAYQNRLEHTINNLSTSAENLTAAESRIRDVDMAQEMMEFTKASILMQASQAMLAQANQQPQGVLQLLR